MTESYDLIIVGAGSAGLPCAIEAADHGGRCLLLEAAEEIGGTLFLTGGHISAAGARRQRERGIEDSVEAHLADLRRISRGTLREDLSGLAVREAAATIDWLDENGFEFDEETPRIVYGHEPYSVARTYYGAKEGLSLLELFERLLEPHLQSGVVTLETSCRVTRLLDREGRVTGVEYEHGGERKTAAAAAVVLATGGYGSNPELFQELDHRPLVSSAAAYARGDGLKMARSLGAHVAGRGDFLPTFGGIPAPDGDSGRAQWSDRPLLVANERVPWEIYVTRDGRRFVAEDEESMHLKEEALAEVEDLTFFTVFDDRAVDESPDIVIGWSPDHLREQAGTRRGVHVAATIGDLAETAGIDRAGLERTVEEYNAAVAAGVDGAFGRRELPAPIARAPFYAMRNHGVTLITFAGVDVDATMRVRRPDGSTIEGLYAIGEVLGASATMGRSFCSGMSLGPAVTFGRLVGRALAERGRARESG